MSLEKPRKLMEAIMRRTERGELDWQEAFNDIYQISFKDNSVQLREGPSELPNSDGRAYTVSLLNSEGEVADRFTDEDLDRDEFGSAGRDWYQKLATLYSQARRRARGADKVLDEILKEMGDDDIPF